MKVFNTLSRSKEEFVPLEPGKVRMYVCGPTVYNFIHIGNARPMIVFDTVRRYFEYKGYQVNYVSNFTDVDDKIIKKANEEGVDSSVISERYIAECKKDMDGMNIEPATKNPKATEEIGGMIDMIQTLIDKGYAYAAADGTVYYRTRKFKGYGKLSWKNLDDLQSGFREIKVTGADNKEDELDFVLWKPKKEGEPYWESPWCQGRPGWHIECSVMSKRYLGEQIDIHAGGEDLIFPHHENEIAQSEAANGKPFATYWMHNAFLNIDNRKMSKSLGNFFTVREAAAAYGYDTIRYFMLSSHYRSPLNYSADILGQCAASLKRLCNADARAAELVTTGAEGAIKPDEQAIVDTFDSYRTRFDEAMDDDFNTANAVSVFFELVRTVNAGLAEKNEPTKAFAVLCKGMIDEFNNVLGLIYDVPAVGEAREEDTAWIEEAIAARAAAKKEKNWAEADRIRDELKAKGVILKDSKQGTTWEMA